MVKSELKQMWEARCVMQAKMLDVGELSAMIRRTIALIRAEGDCHEQRDGAPESEGNLNDDGVINSGGTRTIP